MSNPWLLFVAFDNRRQGIYRCRFLTAVVVASPLGFMTARLAAPRPPSRCKSERLEFGRVKETRLW